MAATRPSAIRTSTTICQQEHNSRAPVRPRSRACFPRVLCASCIVCLLKPYCQYTRVYSRKKIQLGICPAGFLEAPRRGRRRPFFDGGSGAKPPKFFLTPKTPAWVSAMRRPGLISRRPMSGVRDILSFCDHTDNRTCHTQARPRPKAIRVPKAVLMARIMIVRKPVWSRQRRKISHVGIRYSTIVSQFQQVPAMASRALSAMFAMYAML